MTKLDTLRDAFPHTETCVYLHHAAVSPMSRPVVQAIHAYLEEKHRTNVENYFTFMPTLEATRQHLADLIGTDISRVEFAPNTSYALNVLAQGYPWQPGDRLAIPACEFPANVYPFMNLASHGVTVDFIPHDQGTFTLEDIEATLTPQTRLLTLSWVQFLSGFKADLKAIGALCKANDVLFCVDGIQGLGAFPLDVKEAQIDFLACGGHKWLMAQQGIGFLYLTEALQNKLATTAGWLHGPVDWDNFFDYQLSFHPDATRYRLGTTNNIGIAALHAALGLYMETGVDWCANQVALRAQEMADGLVHMGLNRYGTEDSAHGSGIVTVEHPDPEGAFAYLEAQNVVMGLRNRMLRFAPTYYNTANEIAHALEVLQSYGRTQVAVNREASL